MSKTIKQVNKEIENIDKPSNRYHMMAVGLNKNYDEKHGTDRTAKGKSIVRHQRKSKEKSLNKFK